MTTLFQLFNQSSEKSLIRFLNSRIEEELKSARLLREGMWSGAVVVGDKAFVHLFVHLFVHCWAGTNVVIRD